MVRSSSRVQLLHYEMLGVAQSASLAEIHKAYKLRARQVHPDKNPSDAGATEAFQRLQAAYEILSDADKRSCYDATGDSSDFGIDSIRELIRAQFRPVTKDQIDDFLKQYRNSAEERCDIAEFVRRQKGNVGNLFSYIVGSEAADLERFEGLLQDILKSGEAPAQYTVLVQESLPTLRRNASKLAKTGRRASSSRGIANVDLAALSVQLNSRQRSWSSKIVDALESKYCPTASSSTPAGPSLALQKTTTLPTALKKRPAATACNSAKGKSRKT